MFAFFATMKSFIFSFCILVIWASSVNCADDCLITTKFGKLRGTEAESRNGKKFCSFLGIPFAKDVQRFHDAELLNRWEGILDAQNAGPPCPQMDDRTGGVYGDENKCLSLNVFYPTDDQCSAEDNTNNIREDSKSLPVFVHIHGGTYVSGRGSRYGPKYWMDECVVFVTINYRLGALGFLTTEDGLIPGNLGLKDQRLALKWIQMNIKGFGGNPNLVTINGISAGSCSVSHLLTSTSAQGLFHRAIAQSGSALNPWGISKNPGQKARRLGQLLSCSQDNNSTNQITTDALRTCLLTKSVKDIVIGQNRLGIWNNDPAVPFGPVVEVNTTRNAFHLANPLYKVKYGLISRVPLMQGFTEDEGLLLQALPIFSNKSAIKDMNDNWTYVAPLSLMYDGNYIPQEKKDEFSQKIYQFYFGNNSISDETMQNLTNLYSDRYFVQGTLKNIQYHSQYASVYPYVFSFKGDFSVARTFGYKKPAATHGDDIQYFFSDVLAPFKKGSADGTNSEKLIKLWMSFIKTGKPSQTWPAVDSWKPYNPAARGPWYRLDTSSQEMRNYLEERRDFWDNLGLDPYDYPLF